MLKKRGSEIVFLESPNEHGKALGGSHMPVLIRCNTCQLCCIFANSYSRTKKTGPVSLGVAENTLMHDDLLDYCAKHFQLYPSDLTYGTALKGSERLFHAFLTLFTTYFKPYEPLKKEYMVTGSGVGSLMDQLIAMLCDEGDGILTTAPFYSGFAKDVGCRNRCSIIPINVDKYTAGTSEHLQAFEERMKSGESPAPKAVILCNPHNPLGYCYTREALLDYCRFVEKHDIHLIVDEIYALSTFDNKDRKRTPFTSILSVDVLKEAGCHPDRVHLLYGASKDFCMNGLRIGCLYSKNIRLLDSFTAPALFIKVSSASDALFSALISNAADLQHFVQTNQSRLGQAYAFATNWLDAHDIPYIPSYAGHFVFINLRNFLPDTDFKTGLCLEKEKEKEASLFLRLLDSGVYIAPGAFYEYHQAGWFRLTFTVTEDIMQVGLDRLGAALGLKDRIEDQAQLTHRDLNRLTKSFSSATLTSEIDQGVPCIC